MNLSKQQAKQDVENFQREFRVRTHRKKRWSTVKKYAATTRIIYRRIMYGYKYVITAISTAILKADGQ
jgi:hypothetical protein